MTKSDEKNLISSEPAGLASYEAVLVMDPSLSKEVQREVLQKIKNCITQDFNGSIYHIDTWGIRNLLNHNRKKWRQGIYFHFSFQAKKEVVQELTRRMRMAEEVLYYHFQRLTKHTTLEANLKSFREIIEISVKRESERQARIQQRKKHQTNQTLQTDNRQSFSSAPSS